MNEVTRKIAVITGGSRGLGRNTVLSLANRGVDSIFTYHSNQAEAQKVVDQVADTGNRAVALQLDTGNVRTFDSCVTALKQVLAKLDADRFDYLINNAGTSLHKNFVQMSEEELVEWEKQEEEDRKKREKEKKDREHL